MGIRRQRGVAISTPHSSWHRQPTRVAEHQRGHDTSLLPSPPRKTHVVMISTTCNHLRRILATPPCRQCEVGTGAPLTGTKQVCTSRSFAQGVWDLPGAEQTPAPATAISKGGNAAPLASDQVFYPGKTHGLETERNEEEGYPHPAD